MGARCAICLQPIVARNQVVVAETEVLHKACAASGAPTIRAKLEQSLAETRAEIERSRGEAQRSRVAAHEARAAEASAQARIRRLTDEAERHAAARTAAQARARQLATELEAALAEVRRLTTSPPESVDGVEDQDASRVRFALLDLD